jgi:hypothetical protein
MKKILFAAIAATVMMQSTADAQSKYYMREKIVGMPTTTAQGVPATTTPPVTYTYEATYGAFGACESNSQTASISNCRRSDGQTVADSFCTPQTKQQTCVSPPVKTYNCSIRNGYVFYVTGVKVNASSTGSTSVDEARKTCEYATKTVKGCIVSKQTNGTYDASGFDWSTGSTEYNGNANFSAGYCAKI